MTYENFLFSQLFMEHVENSNTKYNQLEYDLIFPHMIEHNELFKTSLYYLEMKSEYDCILDYLNNEVN